VVRYSDHTNANGADPVNEAKRISLRLAEPVMLITSRRRFRMHGNILHRSLNRSLKRVRCTRAAGLVPAERIGIFG
jgi:hypothetical protein